MINERMLELSLLESVLNRARTNHEYGELLLKNYDVRKILTRYDELGKEFLSPYTKDTAR